MLEWFTTTIAADIAVYDNDYYDHNGNNQKCSCT